MAIHEQNYVRYEGSLRTSGAWWTIARASLGVYWSFTRTKLTLLLVSLGPIIFTVLTFLEYTFRQSAAGNIGGKGPPGTGALIFFMHMQLIALALVFSAGGCGVIADDLRYKTFQLYFSKPITRAEYAIGKTMSLFLLGSLVTLVPTLTLMAFRMALFARTDHLGVVTKHMGIGVGLLALVTLLLSMLLSGLSSLTERTGYVVLAWLGVLTVPMVFQLMINLAVQGSDLGHLISVSGNMHLIARWLMDGTDFTMGVGGMKQSPVFNVLPLLALGSLGGGGAALLWRRINKLEGVA